MPHPDPGAAARAEEQAVLDVLYRRLDVLRAETEARLSGLVRSRAGGNPAARSERDAFVARDSDRLARLRAVEEGLCFGRLDTDEGTTLHVGRIGLSDERQASLLIDWRAPRAEPFYRATARHPEGVRRRRHIRTEGRSVIAVDDDVLDLELLDRTGAGRGDGPGDGPGDGDGDELVGEAALLAALAAGRTGHLREVVATLQAEQDRVVRAPMDAPLLVQGGPGTGKTVVALHRAAYLLYTHRARLARRGVLVVGPGRAFMRYVSQVLPSLGETAAVLTSLGELLPGVVAEAPEPEAAAALKGSLRMVEVLADAAQRVVRLPDQPVTLTVDGRRLRVTPRSCEQALAAARTSRRPPNLARNVFLRRVLSDLARQQEGRESWHGLERTERDLLLRDLIRDPQVRAWVNRTWPFLTPQRLLTELYADPDRLAPRLSAPERDALRRPEGSAWTVADVPLLDEALAALGAEAAAMTAARAARARTEADRSFARQVLDNTGAGGMVSAEQLAERYAGEPESRDLAERAAADPHWTYGHLIVDEAQDLSPMAWRALLRRCPSLSITAVGDLAQASVPGAASSWRALRDGPLGGSATLVELTVGYRTPEPVMTLAARVLAAIDPELSAPRAVRSGADPVLLAVPAPELAAAVTAQVLSWRRDAPQRRCAVICPAARRDGLHDAVSAALVAAGLAPAGPPEAATVTVLTARESKGLEFDQVLVADPHAIREATTRGLGELYVALTRTTGVLAVIAPDALPELLTG